MTKRGTASGNFVIALFVVIAFIAVVVMDNMGLSQKWHAAMMWTVVAFPGVVVVYKTEWREWSFWAAMSTYFVVHILGMWVIFDQLLATAKFVGILYAIPFGFIEGIFLLGLVPALQRKLQDGGSPSLNS